MFATKFPSQNARQIKNLSHKMLWFWYSTRSKARQLAKTVKGTTQIHTVWITNQVGIIQVRNRSCFCLLCKNNQQCVTNEAGQKKIVSIIYLKTVYHIHVWCFVICNKNLWSGIIEKMNIMNDTQIYSINF